MAVYFCDFTKNAQNQMKKYRLSNDDIQEVFNMGFTESQFSRILDKNGYRVGIQYQYDAYTLRYVIISVYKRVLNPLKLKIE